MFSFADKLFALVRDLWTNCQGQIHEKKCLFPVRLDLTEPINFMWELPPVFFNYVGMLLFNIQLNHHYYWILCVCFVYVMCLCFKPGDSFTQILMFSPTFKLNFKAIHFYYQLPELYYFYDQIFLTIYFVKLSGNIENNIDVKISFQPFGSTMW